MDGRLLELGQQIVELAQKRGATVAEAVVSQSKELEVKVRLGEVEKVEEAASRSAGLRVIAGDRVATAATSDLTPGGIETLIADAIELASLSQPDPFAAPPDPALLAKTFPDLDLFDPAAETLDARAAIARAKQAERAAQEHDRRITNSEGASFSRSVGGSALVTSGGFAGAYRGTNFALAVSPVADDQGGKKQSATHWDSRRHLADLEAAESIGVEAARRTLARLGSSGIATAELPVVFHPDAARALLSLLVGCLSGGAIYRRSSYLCEREGQPVASDAVTIDDDPLIPRGPGSRPFDGEGLPARKNRVVDAGRLSTFLLDSYSARKLGKASTGNAARGGGGAIAVSPSNFVLRPGSKAPEQIVAETERGLYVTSMMGFGFNPTTGDFSRGAEGFLIEGGKLGRPISEVTVSLGFTELWPRIDAVGSDLDLRGRVAAPTIRVSRMTVAGVG